MLICICLCISGCAKKIADPGKQDEPGIVGGYEPAGSGEITEELMEIWNSANGDGNLDDFTPLELLATQVVAGTNYLFLAEIPVQGNDTVLKEITIYRDLSGNCNVLEITDHQE